MIGLVSVTILGFFLDMASILLDLRMDNRAARNNTEIDESKHSWIAAMGETQNNDQNKVTEG